jgi:hypothetical protein
MLVDIDSKARNDYIIEDLDEEHVLVKEAKVAELKRALQLVVLPFVLRLRFRLTACPDDER